MYSEGSVAVDKESEEGKRVLVKEIHSDTRCDEHWTGQYDYNMNKLMVSDYEGNDSYPDDDSVVTVFYVESLERAGIPWRDENVDELGEAAERENVKTYDLPLSRLAQSSEAET